MSTPNKIKTNRKRKKTEVLRGRCEPTLKESFSAFVTDSGLPESHWVRVAVTEFMDRKAKAA